MEITKGNKWVKIAFEYTRHDGGLSGRDQGNPIRLEKITFENVKAAVKTWIKEWVGRGQVKIYWLETGPFKEDLLSESESVYFENKIYTFDN